ncbi:MAG: hypothetical protein RIR11_609 [Bacteroidota bacterium]|jgi:hypothetical protein
MQSIDLELNNATNTRPTDTETNRPLWWIKLTHYEYWPWMLLYAPMLFVWLWNVLKTGKWVYFSAVNPTFSEGGFYGESKKEILDLIPDEYKPVTVLIDKNLDPAPQVRFFKFPVIAKPDVGERGSGVAKIESIADLQQYHAATDRDYIVQEYVDYATEVALLYSRMPNEPTGVVSSLTIKGFLSVTGDGASTLEALVAGQSRARFQAERLREKYADLWNTVVPMGQKMELESIGNHCRGTQFIKANHLINKQLNVSFDHIAKQIAGFQYGRFDLRVASLEDLMLGKNIRIVELNGVSADPAHIYDNSHGLLRTYRDLLWHWNRIGDISKINLKQGGVAASPALIWEKFRTRNL